MTIPTTPGIPIPTVRSPRSLCPPGDISNTNGPRLPDETRGPTISKATYTRINKRSIFFRAFFRNFFIQWYERDNQRQRSGQVTIVAYAETKLLGGCPDAIGSSPRRLLVSTLPDELKIAKRSGKVIGISMKDRSAILPAGHTADAAYWF